MSGTRFLDVDHAAGHSAGAIKIGNGAPMADAETMTWQLALPIGLLIGFIVGFATGYGIRAAMAFRRYYSSPRAWFRDPAL